VTAHGTEPWPALLDRIASCRHCHAGKLLHPGASPLFCQFRGQRSDLLFVLEAPNHDDTFRPDKGYLTYDRDTDPSGRFFRELYMEVLGEPIEHAAVTNAVLCLPAGGGGRYPVTARTMRNCSMHLRDQIASLDPLVVVTLGAKALEAARLLQDHGRRKLADVVATPVSWLGRTLFPVYHTGMLARNGPFGRTADKQRDDWRQLREVLQTLRSRT